jgi:hypothetical protein
MNYTSGSIGQPPNGFCKEVLGLTYLPGGDLSAGMLALPSYDLFGWLTKLFPDIAGKLDMELVLGTVPSADVVQIAPERNVQQVLLVRSPNEVALPLFELAFLSL